MSVTVRLPDFLSRHAGGAAAVEARGATVGEALTNAFSGRPELASRVIDARGAVFPYLAILLNGAEVPRSGLLGAALCDGDVLEVLAAAEGG